jgi:hypothetical protein
LNFSAFPVFHPHVRHHDADRVVGVGPFVLEGLLAGQDGERENVADLHAQGDHQQAQQHVFEPVVYFVKVRVHAQDERYDGRHLDARKVEDANPPVGGSHQRQAGKRNHRPGDGFGNIFHEW